MSLAGKLRIDGVRFIGLLLKTMLYGMDWVLLFMCLSTLTDRPKGHQNRVILIVIVAIFCSITGNWLTTTIQLFKAFVPPHGSYCVVPGGLTQTEKALWIINDPLNVAGTAFWIITTLFADWFLVYRLYVLWPHKRWLVIPPIMISIGSVVSGMMVLVLLPKAVIPGPKSQHWTTSFFVSTVACNVYATCTIAVRLIYSGKHLRFHISGIRKKVMEVLIQSAAIYCLVTILSMVFILTSCIMMYITIDLTIPIIGLNFCLIILRTHHDHAPDVHVVQLHADDPGRIEFASVTESAGTTLTSPC